MIGQRWREILPDELAKYQDLAKKDAERYRNEMKVFYEEELALMCSGHASVADSLDDDRKPSATVQKPTHDKQTGQNSQPQQQQQTIGRERFTAASPSAALSAPDCASSLAMATQTSTNVIGSEQLLKLQTMLQHQESNTFSVRELNRESLINEISVQRLAIQQRLVTLFQESEMLRAKDRLLEQLFANLSGASGSSHNSTDAMTSVAAPSAAGFQPSISSDLQALFPHNTHKDPTPRAGKFGGTGPVTIASSLGSLLNQPQQDLTTDNTSLIIQLMASRGQLHQQFAASLGAPPAAASSSNQSSTTADDCTNLSLFANNITNSLQTGPMHDLQKLMARSVSGNTSQSQISGLFGLAGSFFLGNPNNSSQPPPEIATLIAQIVASQQNEERTSGHAGDSERT